MKAGVSYRLRSASHGRVAWRDVAAFTVLALLVVRVVGAVALEALFPNAPDFVIDLVDNYTPAIAALLMLLFVSREGLRGSLGPLGPWRLHVSAVLLPALLTLIAVLVVAALGSGRFGTETGEPLWSAIPALVAVTLLMVFGEEYGWRGYLLPKLLPLGEVRASLIVGVIWGVWHFPNALQESTTVDAITVLVFYIIANTALSPLFTRFFLVSGGSVAVVWILHASFNVFYTLAFEHLMVVDQLLSASLLLVLTAMASGLMYWRRPSANTATAH